MTDLANKIMVFLEKHAMEPTALGVKISNDSHLIWSIIRKERNPRRATVRKIEDFMKVYRAAKKGGGRK